MCSSFIICLNRQNPEHLRDGLWNKNVTNEVGKIPCLPWGKVKMGRLSAQDSSRVFSPDFSPPLLLLTAWTTKLPQPFHSSIIPFLSAPLIWVTTPVVTYPSSIKFIFSIFFLSGLTVSSHCSKSTVLQAYASICHSVTLLKKSGIHCWQDKLKCKLFIVCSSPDTFKYINVRIILSSRCVWIGFWKFNWLMIHSNSVSSTTVLGPAGMLQETRLKVLLNWSNLVHMAWKITSRKQSGWPCMLWLC